MLTSLFTAAATRASAAAAFVCIADMPPLGAMPPSLQVAALLAQMEVAGLGFDPWLLGQAGQLARSHMARIEDESASVAGRPFNLSSPQQLAEVLYRVLKVGKQ